MKRFTVIIFVVFFLFSIVPVSIYASNSDKINKPVTLAQNQVIDDDYFAAGDRVEVFGTVNGDVYAAGGQVIIDGTVNGDVLVAGGTVNISGSVTQDVRVVGGTVIISGTVGRNVTFAGGDITFSESGQLGGNLVGVGGNVLISTDVPQNIKVASGNLTITNAVAGNIDAAVDQMRVTSGANILGNLTYWSEFDASIDETATVGGTLTKKQTIPHDVNVQKDTKNGIGSGFYIYKALSSLVFGLILIRLFSTQLIAATKVLVTKPWASLGMGFAVLFLTPLAAILIIITIIGIPVGTTLLVLYGICLSLAKYVSMTCAGDWILNKINFKSKSVYKSFIAGLILYLVLQLSPITSFLASVGYLLFGLGAIAYTINKSFSNRKA